MDRGRRRAAYAAMCCLALAAFALVAATCAEREVPAALLGRWTSSDPRYAGRTLEIGRASLEFGNGDVLGDSFLIEGVESEATSNGVTLHIVTYRDAEGPTRTLRLEQLPGSAPTLRLENHEEIWTRAPGSVPSRGGRG